jgi:hypothetical protein
MIRPAAASLASRTLRPSPAASASVAQRPALKSPAAQLALHTDRFDRGPARSQGARPSGLLGNDNRVPSQSTGIRYQPKDRVSAQQQLDFQRKWGGPKRENFPPTPSGTQQYNEAQTRYERRIDRLEAHVKYDKLKEHGGPQREDYPKTLKGALAYDKARDAYIKNLQELALAAGIYVN